MVKTLSGDRHFRLITVLSFFVLVTAYFFALPFQFYLVDQFHSEAVTDFDDGQEISQTFLCYQPIHSIALKFATFGRENTGQITFSLFIHHETEGDQGAYIPGEQSAAEAGKELVWTGTIQLERLMDNHYYELTPPPDTSKHKGLFSLVLNATESSPQKGVSPWFSLFNAYDRGALYLAGQQSLGDLTFRVTVQTTAFRLIQSLSGPGEKCSLAQSKAPIYTLLILILLGGSLALFFLGSKNIERDEHED
ncbi:hypothetical protein ACFL27_22360 [candidate division CSSED10-310 bacterium]|uniref:Uncharacterized protein n=1 Tax=candidate division CSSED10-310 bacterium TaxID=2855610 RepID=A0ABV6Z3C9_UNCC1